MARPETTTMAIDIVDHELPDYTHNTYSVLFFGDSIFTTVTHDAAIASQWISDIEFIHRRRLQHLIVGLDLEWRASFNRYISNPVATLQLSVGRRCLIFQLIYCSSIPSSLVNFLANPNYTFVGVGIKQDLEKLEEDYEFGYNTNAVDLRSLAAEAYDEKKLKNAGVKELARVVMGKEVDKPKGVTMSRWDNQWLTPAQVQYACVDAFVCFEIGRILNASSHPSSSASGTASGRR
ncbi:DNA helicase [Handroanthus impetiginosus]|uniref:DNA helicase n=1 Tax=Handroanthus impetiginosus TaxID=429701 RepID=A0A2G9HQ40_9LAMI|nr:DNA helicase [Handroanthus impetiginosus]